MRLTNATFARVRTANIAVKAGRNLTPLRRFKIDPPGVVREPA
jgi:hypothetical protein